MPKAPRTCHGNRFRHGYAEVLWAFELAILGGSRVSRLAFVAIGNRERHVRKASHCGSKQQ